MKKLFYPIFTSLLLSFAACSDLQESEFEPKVKDEGKLELNAESDTILMKFSTEDLNKKLSLNVCGNDIYVDWGDGIQNKYNRNQSDNNYIVHEYAANESYIVKISTPNLLKLDVSTEYVKKFEMRFGKSPMLNCLKIMHNWNFPVDGHTIDEVIDITSCPNLDTLEIWGTTAKELKMVASPPIKKLSIYATRFEKIDLNNFSQLNDLLLGCNLSLIEFKMGNNVELKKMHIESIGSYQSSNPSQTFDLDLSSAVNLARFSIWSGSNIRSIKFPETDALTYLEVLYTEVLKTLDLSKLHQLEYLSVTETVLEEIKIATPNALRNIGIRDNALDETALNNIFSSLSYNNPEVAELPPITWPSYSIFFGGNPGTSNANTKILETKRWRIEGMPLDK